jgi:hypothetical protein
MQDTQTKKRNWGGARKGAGRPKGSTDKVTINGLLEALARKTQKREYEDILIEDFLQARKNNDSHLVLKYHTLILGKVMSQLSKVEIVSNEDTIAAKQAAFAEALAKLTRN